MTAVVIGATGGIGAALCAAIDPAPIALSRRSDPPLDLLDEASIAQAATRCGDQLRLVIDATGWLHDSRFRPEKSLRELDPAHLAHAFALNAAGPALLMKHFLPRLARDGRATFATLSARVGSISDNRLGGWYSYRTSKAALNQLVRCAAIELRRTHPDAVCVSLHPGTIATALSSPFAKTGLDVATPDVAAARLLRVLNSLDSSRTGTLIDQNGSTVAP